MAIKTYVNFNGNCREAVEFYAEVFQTEQPKFMLFGDKPSDYPLTEEAKKLVMHTEIKIKESTIMFSDVLPDMSLIIGNNISLIYTSNDIDEMKSIFNKLKVDGIVTMDIQETFWSKCYGYLVDKYGISWQLSYE